MSRIDGVFRVVKSMWSDYYKKVLFSRPNYNGFKHL